MRSVAGRCHRDSPPRSRVSKIMAHSHCDGCYLASCRASSSNDACPVKPCPGGCGVVLHGCKVDEHSLYTCPTTPVPCTNTVYGCESVLPRARLGSHLAHCPASVVRCRFAYDRTSLDESTPPTPDVEDKSVHERQQLPCIDERALEADLALAEQDDRLYGRRSDDLPLRFSLDCHPGSLLTDPSSKSTARNHNLPPRTRVCISASVPQYGYTIGKYLPFNYFCFPCNEIARRDEFSGHWRDCHIGVQTSLSVIVERCPLRNYGCQHRVHRLTPTPKGASLEYLREADCVSVKFPDQVTNESPYPLPGSYAQHIQKQQELALYGYGDETDSYDVLSQLPAEILMKICGCLDSLGLWNLSLVNRYLRSVCLNLVKRRGIVYCCWQRNKATGKWEQGEKVWICMHTLFPYMCGVCWLLMSSSAASYSLPLFDVAKALL